ncbi:hypothetical protein SAMN05216559_4101 [Halomicrobium zhouii]|uniref:Uncharacterized protein n=1 Tax=Halomicrobium zhouii TaxID=767519 RepID=A0A1I6MAM8_9EURY|nr:hypothetical protein [Halomicrobium zhouii]SFS12668.1 hypothetical protein SAMN05216559_4101 [Halomicrobium zhouii]
MVLQTDLETAVEAADDVPPASDVYEAAADISVTDVFDDEFVAAHTPFDTFDELVAASPADATSADELDTVPDGAWDEFVAERTDFEDEEAMVFAARDHWVAKRLGV